MTGTRRMVAVLAVLFAVVLALLVAGSSDPVRQGADAGFTYGYLPSLFRGDLDFTDDAVPFDSAMPHTRTGRTHNAFPIGPALWWTPAFAVADAGVLVVSTISDGAGPAPDGRSWPYSVIVGLGALLVGFAGVMATIAAARRVASPSSASAAGIVLLLAGPPLYYAIVEPTVSHAAGFASAAVLLATWLRLRDAPASAWNQLLLGLVVALAALCRWQNVILAIGPFVDVATGRIGAADGRRLAGIARFSLACVLGFAPQLATWAFLYGSPFRPPRGETAGAYLDVENLHVIDVLFSWRHGALSWHPILAVGLLGLAAVARSHRRVAAALAGSVLAMVVVNATVLDWWAGASFGARRFDGVWPAAALGLAALIDRVPRFVAGAAAGAAMVANWLLAGVFVSGGVSRIERVTPADVLDAMSMRSLAPGIDDWSFRKAAWVVGLLVVGGLAVATPSTWRRPRATPRTLVGLGTASTLVVTAVVIGAGANTPPRFDPTVFEAGYFVPQPTEPVRTDRIVRPDDEEPWTLVWSMPGFLPPGRYVPTVVASVEEGDTARVTVELDGRTIVAGDVGPRRRAIVGAPVTTEVGFLRLAIRSTGGVARVESVHLEPA